MVGSHSLYVAMAYFLARYELNEDMLNTTAVGISALLFALKVLANSRVIIPYAPEATVFQGIVIPTEYVAWAELVLISLITPNASFAGHLCGILAGMFFIPLYKYRNNLRLLQLFMALFGIGVVGSQAQIRRRSEEDNSARPSGRRIDGGVIMDARSHSNQMRYAKQIQQLYDMGFTDRQRNQDALEFANGDVETAIAFLTRS
jgi:hypothetical protein